MAHPPHRGFTMILIQASSTVDPGLVWLQFVRGLVPAVPDFSSKRSSERRRPEGDDQHSIINQAKASFSPYVLVKMLLKTGEKSALFDKKSTTNFGLPFCFFPFPFLASKWLLKYAAFALQKAKKRRQKTRPQP